MSIQLRLALSTTIVLVFSLLVGFGLTYGHVVAKVRTELGAALAFRANGALDALGTTEGADPAQRLRGIVHDFDGDRHVRAELVAPDGRVVAQSRLLAPEEQAPRWFARITVRDMPARVLALPPSLRDSGTLVLHADPHNEVAEAWRDRKSVVPRGATRQQGPPGHKY